VREESEALAPPRKKRLIVEKFICVWAPKEESSGDQERGGMKHQGSENSLLAPDPGADRSRGIQRCDSAVEDFLSSGPNEDGNLPGKAFQGSLTGGRIDKKSTLSRMVKARKDRGVQKRVKQYSPPIPKKVAFKEGRSKGKRGRQTREELGKEETTCEAPTLPSWGFSQGRPAQEKAI